MRGHCALFTQGHVARSGWHSGSACASHDPEILELPRIGSIDIFGEKLAPLIERRPVAVRTHDVAEVRIGDFQYALKIEIIRIAYAALRIFHRPDDARHDTGGDL